MPHESEYDRDLTQQDLEDLAIIRDIVQGLREARSGEFVPESILDILDED